MEFFLDTGIISEIKEAVQLGIIDGVTTNPSLIAKTGRKQEDVIREICEIIDGPISAEVIATDLSGMIKEGEEEAALTHLRFLFVEEEAEEVVEDCVTLCHREA